MLPFAGQTMLNLLLINLVYLIPWDNSLSNSGSLYAVKKQCVLKTPYSENLAS